MKDGDFSQDDSSQDSFIKDLGQAWQQEKRKPELSIKNALRANRMAKIKYYLHIAIIGVSIAFALWFLLLPSSVITIAAGLFLLAAVLVDGFYLIRFRKPITNWVDWSPEGLLNYHQSLLKAELNSAKYFVYSSAGLQVFIIFVWVLAHFDQEFATTGFHLIFTFIATPISLFLTLFYGRKLKSKDERKKKLDQITDDYS